MNKSVLWWVETGRWRWVGVKNLHWLNKPSLYFLKCVHVQVDGKCRKEDCYVLKGMARRAIFHTKCIIPAFFPLKWECFSLDIKMIFSSFPCSYVQLLDQ